MKLRFALLPVVTLICFVALISLSPNRALAQNEIKCGAIVEGELTKRREAVFYGIQFAPGYQTTIVLRTFGDTFRGGLIVTDPVDIELYSNGYNLDRLVTYNSDVLSGRGLYKIRVANYYASGNGGIGRYQLTIRCVTDQGAVIEPGGSLTPSSNTTPNLPTTVTTSEPTAGGRGATTLSGVGFPGLAPVEFAGVTATQLRAGIPISETIGVSDNRVRLFTHQTVAGNILTVFVDRPSGNLGAAIVILDPSNAVVFQSSLISSNLLWTQLTATSTGVYTIALYPLNYARVTAPKPTTISLWLK